MSALTRPRGKRPPSPERCGPAPPTTASSSLFPPNMRAPASARTAIGRPRLDGEHLLPAERRAPSTSPSERMSTLWLGQRVNLPGGDGVESKDVQVEVGAIDRGWRSKDEENATRGDVGVLNERYCT